VGAALAKTGHVLRELPSRFGVSGKLMFHAMGSSIRKAFTVLDGKL
jgi:hypothetical protein